MNILKKVAKFVFNAVKWTFIATKNLLVDTIRLTLSLPTRHPLISALYLGYYLGIWAMTVALVGFKAKMLGYILLYAAGAAVYFGFWESIMIRFLAWAEKCSYEEASKLYHDSCYQFGVDLHKGAKAVSDWILNLRWKQWGDKVKAKVVDIVDITDEDLDKVIDGEFKVNLGGAKA